MEFSHVIQDDVLVITLQQENLDAMTVPSFKTEIVSLIERVGLKKVIFDLSHLKFIDSSGLGSFLAIQRMLNKNGGALKLAYLKKPVQTIFEIVSMHHIFEISPTVEEAIKSF